jgi:hypothetical protein
MDRIGREAAAGGLPLQRFEVLHLVRPASSEAGVRAPVTRLVRGNVILPPRSLGSATLDAMVGRLGAHLLASADEKARFQGTYQPTSDQFDPALASDEDVSLICYALSRWAGFVATRDSVDPRLKQIQAQLATSLSAFAPRVDPKAPGASPAAMALMLMVLSDTRGLESDKQVRDELGKRLLALRETADPAEGDAVAGGPAADRAPTGALRSGVTPGTPRLNASSHALVTASLAHLYSRTRDEALLVEVKRMQDYLWSNFDLEQAINALPWVIDTERRLRRWDRPSPALNPELAQAGAAAGPAPAPGIAAGDPLNLAGKLAPAAGAAGGPPKTYAQRVAALMERLQACQITRAPETPAAGPADVVGGCDFTGAPAGSPPAPDWRTAMAVYVLSAATREPALVAPDHRADCLLTAGLGARFVAQLMFAEPSCYYVRNDALALGGVRMSLWDNRLAPGPSAMALLAALELEDTIAAMQKEGARQ